MRRRAAALAMTAAAVLATAACRADQQPEREPDITGVITAISPGPSDGPLGTIRVETVPEDESGTPKASVTINPDTRILGDTGSDGAPFTALREGMLVHVWFTGPVRESYPVQATAERVVMDVPTP